MERNEVSLGDNPTVCLRVDGLEYLIAFPLSAVIEAEANLGRCLKAPADWFGAPAKDIPALIKAGLSKHHPEVTAEEIEAICDRLNPEAYGEFAEALGALTFPKFLSRFQAGLAKVESPAAQEAN